MSWLRDLFLDLRNGLIAARRQRRMIQELKLADMSYVQHRPKIVRVGELDVGPGESFRIKAGWELEFDSFSYPEQAICYPVTREDLDGTKRIFGYTLAELQHFYARRAEFNVDA